MKSTFDTNESQLASNPHQFSNSGYNTFEVFNPSAARGGKLNITQMGRWNLTDGFSLSNWQTKIQRRHDLKQLWFQTATAVNL